MDIIQAMLCHTFFWLLAAGLWPYLGYLLLIYLTRLDLSGKSKYNLYLVSDLSAMFIDYFLSFHLFRVVEDFRDWTNWLLYRGGIGVKGEESWEAWWDEELVFNILPTQIKNWCPCNMTFWMLSPPNDLSHFAISTGTHQKYWFENSRDDP